MTLTYRTTCELSSEGVECSTTGWRGGAIYGMNGGRRFLFSLLKLPDFCARIRYKDLHPVLKAN